MEMVGGEFSSWYKGGVENAGDLEKTSSYFIIFIGGSHVQKLFQNPSSSPPPYSFSLPSHCRVGVGVGVEKNQT